MKNGISIGMAVLGLVLGLGCTTRSVRRSALAPLQVPLAPPPIDDRVGLELSVGTPIAPPNPNAAANVASPAGLFVPRAQYGLGLAVRPQPEMAIGLRLDGASTAGALPANLALPDLGSEPLLGMNAGGQVVREWGTGLGINAGLQASLHLLPYSVSTCEGLCSGTPNVTGVAPVVGAGFTLLATYRRGPFSTFVGGHAATHPANERVGQTWNVEGSSVGIGPVALYAASGVRFDLVDALSMNFRALWQLNSAPIRTSPFASLGMAYEFPPPSGGPPSR